MTTVDDPRRQLPRTDAVLAQPQLADAVQRLGRDRVRRAVSLALDELRAGGATHPPSATKLAGTIASALPAAPTSMQPVVNATGVVLHTNLGRAPLSNAAVAAIGQAAGYADVEFDLATGRRAGRGRGALDALAGAVPAAEAVHVVNNGAAALALAMVTLAAGREVVVSRGELVEIGDGFRLPDLIESTGARLREVGTTNRVSRDDYAAALGPDTACVLKVHPSNFRLEGFTRSVSAADLATLDAPLVVDIGSGLLSPDPLLPAEPDATSTLRAGASVVTCSGDKLLGGPQAGLILGAAELVRPMRRHALARAFRVDKLTLAALEATLAGPPTPTWQALHASPEALRERCAAVVADLADAAASVDARLVASDGVVGGGGAPGLRLPGWAISLPEPFAERLRQGRPPVVGRVEHGRCLLDLRCVPPELDTVLAAAVRAAATAAR